jgi:hypothetical protein
MGVFFRVALQQQLKTFLHYNSTPLLFMALVTWIIYFITFHQLL